MEMNESSNDVSDMEITSGEKLQKITKFRIFVKEGRNISNGIWDAVDTPDSIVEIVVPLSVEKRQHTKTVEAKNNPVWNETLVFHVETEIEESAECEISLIEDNFPLSNQKTGYFKCLLKDLKDSIQFSKDRVIDIKLEKKIIEVEASNPRKKIYQLYKTNLRPIKRVKFLIKEGKNITYGWKDILDTPDTFVQVDMKLSPEKSRRTKTVEKMGNPVWNETLIFHFDPKLEEDTLCEFSLIEDNSPFSNVTVGCKTFPVSNVPSTIIFDKDRSVDLDVKFETVWPDLKARNALSEEENAFCTVRRKRIFDTMQSLLGDTAPKDENHVPNIAIIGSGGGFRAMIGLAGAMNALQSTKVLDCATHLAGLSGSAWYVSTLYSHEEWPECSTEVISKELRENIQYHPDKVALNVPTYINLAMEKTKFGEPWSFTDVFGHMVGETLLKERKNLKWSEQRKRVQSGEAPLPLLACLHAYDKVSAKEFCEWMELSPYEVLIPKYGASIKMEDFGSKFFRGTVYEKRDEPPLHFIQGVCGSAYSVLFEQMKPDETKDAQDKTQNPFYRIIGKIKESIGEGIFNTREMRSARVPNMMRSCSFEPCFKPIFSTITDAVSKMWEPLSTLSDFLCVVDAGLSFNSPYPLILNPHREIDLIISFDFSNRGSDDAQPFKEIKEAEQWAKALHLKFPTIDVKKYEDSGEVLEVYVFEKADDLDCPIVMHFVLVNKHFKKFKKPGVPRETEEEKEFGNFSILDDPDQTYSTFKFHYAPMEYDRLCKLMEFNVLNNIDKIKECFEKAVMKRQKKAK